MADAIGGAVLEPVVARRIDAIRRSLQGFSKTQPLALAADCTDSFLLVPHISNDQKLAALESVTVAGLRDFCRGALGATSPGSEDALSATAFLYGNVSAEDVATVRSVISKALSLDVNVASLEGGVPAASIESQCARALLLPPGTSSTTWLPHTNPQEINAGLIVTWQIGVRTPRNVAVGQLLSSKDGPGR